MEKKRSVGLSVIILITLCISLFIGLNLACIQSSEELSILSEGWRSEIVDNKGDVGSYSSIALDKDNHIYIAYSSEQGLKYAFKNRGAWEIQIIEKGKYAGQDPKIVLDSYGRPHISYFFYDQKRDVRGLKYAHWTGSEWQTMFVNEKGSKGSIAIDSKNRPHIAYDASYGHGLGYAYWDGERWHKQEIDVLGDWRQYKEITLKDRYFGRIDISLVLDDNDNPHIAYFERMSEDLRYVHLVGGKWDIQVVDKEGLVGLEPSIAIDRKGRVHITYLDADHYDLKYAYWDGSERSIQIIDEKENTGCDSIILLDRFDKPHIVYQHCADEELKYAFFRGTNWNIETVETRRIGWTTAQSDTIGMALDSEGRPHISCYDNHKKALKYIWKVRM